MIRPEQDSDTVVGSARHAMREQEGELAGFALGIFELVHALRSTKPYEQK